MEPTEHDPIARRLHSLGSQPVDPEVVASHRNLMASVPVTSSRSRLRPLMVGSLLAGSLLGGMGLAAAAPSVILPTAASEAAQEALNKVTLGVVADPDEDKAQNTPEAKAAAQDAKETRKAAKAANHPAGAHGVARNPAECEYGFDGATGTHGQYVSTVNKIEGVTEAEKTRAAQSDCGKPLHSGNPEVPGANKNKSESSPGKSGEDHGKPEASIENGQSSAEHPDDHADEKAAENVGKNADGAAGNSAGHGPNSVPTP